MALTHDLHAPATTQDIHTVVVPAQRRFALVGPLAVLMRDHPGKLLPNIGRPLRDAARVFRDAPRPWTSRRGEWLS